MRAKIRARRDDKIMGPRVVCVAAAVVTAAPLVRGWQLSSCPLCNIMLLCIATVALTELTAFLTQW
jgi:hypothetical protein